MPGPDTASDLVALWRALARTAGLPDDEPATVALSGGADSTALLLLAARARPRGGLACVHVDHGWRGEQGRADAEHCAALCARLGVPLEVVRLELDPRAPSAEAVARRERYRVLLERARSRGHRVLLVAHHADDALAGALVRWRRGGSPTGLLEPGPGGVVRGAVPGAPVEERREAGSALAPVRLVRPLLPLARSALRTLLVREGLAWREDPTNADLSRARNAVERRLVPLLERVAGARAARGVLELARTRARLDRALAQDAPAPVAPPWAPYTRAPGEHHLGAALPRAPFAGRGAELAAFAIARAVEGAAGTGPARAALLSVARALDAGEPVPRCRVARDWTLEPAGPFLALVPAPGLLTPAPVDVARVVDRGPELRTSDGRRFARSALGRGARAVRTWRAGDRHAPRDGRAGRAVARTLVELAIPAGERARVLVAVDERDHVVAVLRTEPASGDPLPGDG